MKFFKDFKERENVLGQIDFNAFGEKFVSVLRSNLQQVPADDRKILLTWIDQVEEIKKKSGLSESEKESQVENLETGTVVIQFLKSLSERWIDRIPLSQKNLLKTGIGGLGIWALGRTPAMTTLGILAFQKIFPKFLLSIQGDRFLVIARDLLQDESVQIR